MSAETSLAKTSSMDHQLEPVAINQDDWFLYFDRLLSVSPSEHFEKLQREFLCLAFCKNLHTCLGKKW